MNVDWRGIALVSVGAVAGALARFAASTWLPTRGFPWATLLANLLGAFAIGALMLREVPEHATRLLVAVGFLASFTTLSTYAFETVDLWRTQHRDLAILNMLANGVGGPLAAVAGWRVSALWA